MTDYEIAELAISNQELFWQVTANAQEASSMLTGILERFMTVLFAYLVAAHLVARQLTKIQAGILTTLYLFWLGRLALGIHLAQQSLLGILTEMENLNAEFASPSLAPPTLYLLLVLVVAASLYYFWSLRHPGTE